MKKFAEVRNDYFNDEEKCFYIDAWTTKNPNEEGIVVAKVYLSGEVEYTSSDYENIEEVVNSVEKAVEKTKSFI